MIPDTTPDSFPDSLPDWQAQVPFSQQFQDHYYCRDNGLEESRFVFLQHNRLRERWAALPDKPGECFTLGETGFGTGLNFLAAWALWRSFGFRHACLHYVSVEKYPLSVATLQRAHLAWPELAALSQQLCETLPLAYPGIHRRHFPSDRLVLTLLQGDASTCFEQLDARVDAWFLDGFSPECNPDLWSPRLFGALARLSHADTTLASFTCAGQVRRDLQEAGFDVHKTAGYGQKRDMCAGRHKAAAATDESRLLPMQQAPWFRHEKPANRPRSVVVIGAGLAGCAMAWSLAQRGLQVTVLDQASRIASEASGNPIGLTFVRLTTHDSPQNRYYLNAYLHALGLIRQVFTNAGITEGEHWRLNGILRVFDDAEEQAEIEAFLQTPQADLVATRFTPTQLTALAGFPVDRAGLYQPGSGWLNPATLCRALLAHPAIRVQLASPVQSLTREQAWHDQGWDGHAWQVHTPTHTLSADAVVIANSMAAAEFAQTRHLTLRTVRGQITRLSPNDASRCLQHAINYSGYLTPAWQGMHTVGATFHPKRHDREESREDHAENITRLRNALPGFPALPASDDGDFSGRVAFRTGTPDYLPYAGPLPDLDAYRADYREGLGKGQMKRLYPPGTLHPQLYVSAGHGSRGITSSLLAAEVVCHWMLDEPAPVDRDILEALHPARFVIRQLKRRKPV